MYQADMGYDDIVKRDTGKVGHVVFPLVVWTAMALFSFFFVYFFMIITGNLYFPAMLCLGFCYLIYYKFKSYNNTEFEVELLNEFFSVAKVERQKKRTDLAEFSLRDCEYIGPVTCDKFKEFREKADFTLNITSLKKYELKDSNWFCAVNGKGYNYVVVFEFKNPMYKFFRRFNPRNVYIMPMPKDEEKVEEVNEDGI